MSGGRGGGICYGCCHMWKKLAIVLLVLLLLRRRRRDAYLWLPASHCAAGLLSTEHGPGGHARRPSRARRRQLQWRPAEEARPVTMSCAQLPPQGRSLGAGGQGGDRRLARASFEDGQLEAVARRLQAAEGQDEGGRQGLFERARAAFPSLTERDGGIGVEAVAGAEERAGDGDRGAERAGQDRQFTYSLDGAAEARHDPDKLRPGTFTPPNES